MAIDYKKKFYDLKEKEEAELYSTVKQLVKDVQTNNRISEDTRDETKRLADHVAKQNGRITKLESNIGKQFQIEPKAITLIALAAIVFMIVIVAGKEGLGYLDEILSS